VTVEGHTELGQFQPDLKQNNIVVWDANLVRSLQLTFRNMSNVKGINSNRYMLDWQTTFNYSDLFYQSIFGLANMTSFSNVPAYFSNWDLMGVENRTDMVAGLASYESEDDYNTVLDVEPITGAAVQNWKRMQINLYLPSSASTWFHGSAFGNNPQVGIFFPLMRLGEYVIVGDELAVKIKQKLKELPATRMAIFWVSVSIGPALALLGTMLIIFGIRSLKREAGNEHYEKIND